MVGNYECGLCQITFPTDLINFNGGKIVFVELEPVPIDRASPDEIASSSSSSTPTTEEPQKLVPPLTPDTPPTTTDTTQPATETDSDSDSEKTEAPVTTSVPTSTHDSVSRKSRTANRIARAARAAHLAAIRQFRSYMNKRGETNCYMSQEKIALPNYSHEALHFTPMIKKTYNPHKRNQSDEFETGDLGYISNEAELLPSDMSRAAQYGDEVLQIETKAYKRLLNMKRVYTTLTLNPASLSSDMKLVTHLNNVLRHNVIDILAKLKRQLKADDLFGYNSVTRKCSIYLPRNYMMQIPLNLSYQLGFDGQTFFTHTMSAPYVVDVDYRHHNMYVYSDVVRYGIIGDTLAPLLRSFSIDDKDQMIAKKTTTKVFQTPYFVPVRTNNLRELSIYIRDNIGQPITFVRGVVEVVLQFKRVQQVLSGAYT